MTYILLRDYNLLPKRELHLSLWVDEECHGLLGFQPCQHGQIRAGPKLPLALIDLKKASGEMPRYVYYTYTSQNPFFAGS